MNIPLRASLILCSLVVCFFVMRRIKKSSLEVSDSVFWLLIAAALIVVALFPGLAYWVSGLLGFEAASNFIFFCGIIVLLVRTFAQDRKTAVLKKKLTALVQEEALRDE